MNALTKTLPSRRSDITQQDGYYYAYTQKQLDNHDILIGQFEMRAQKDQNNRIYWILPGAKTTSSKRQARRIAQQASKLMIAGVNHEPLNR